MNLQLKSDFRDYYDFMFDRSGEVFERYSKSELHRRDAFELLSRAGYQILPHGTAAQLYSRMGEQLVVAYDDPTAHCGNGKRRATLSSLPPETYCSLYRPQPAALSFRELWIGRLWIGLCYRSDDEWRSNVGNVAIISSGISEDIPRPDVFRDYPLVAVDLIESMENGYAVDFNTAPGLHYPIKDLLSATLVVDYLKEFLSTRYDPRL